MLVGDTVCGFRDSAYLYYPLFQWIDAQWAAKDTPLWNHYDQYGVPVIGDGSSSIFYPLKLIFFLRLLTFESRYGIFLAIHVLIAAATCYWCARRIGCKQGGSTVAAIGYAFGGSVLFQVCNVIYLIGAAWLPLAIGSLWLMVRNRSWKWAILGGVSCALIMLGGDAQLVYNIGLVGIGTVLGNFVSERFRSIQSGPDHVRGAIFKPYVGLFCDLCRLALLVAVTGVLAAIQILPALEWSEESVRKEFRNPRSIYESLTWYRGDVGLDRRGRVFEGLFGPPEDTWHAGHIYQFSQPPWTLGELVVPNFSGKAFPVNTRWSEALPGADRMWNPSIYCGCLIAILAMLNLRLWGKRKRQVWLSRITFFFALGSFGWYGCTWLVGEFVDLSFSSFELGPQTGGLYWLLVLFLPKYVLFRYPAKLFLIASLAICLLVGLRVGKPGRLRWPELVLLFGVPGFLVACLLGVSLSSIWKSVPRDSLFGPFDQAMAFSGIVWSAAHLFAVCAVAAIVFQTFNQRKRLFWCALSVVVAVDVCAANYWLTAQIDSRLFTEEVTHRRSQQNAYAPKYPASWSNTSSEERLEKIVNWQRRASFPKHHLAIERRNETSFSSIERNPGPIFHLTRRLPFAVIVEAGESSKLEPELWSRRNVSGEPKLIEQRNGFYEFEVDLDKAGYLCVQSLYVPGWHATVQSEGRSQVRVNIVPWLGSLTAIEVPHGESRVELFYRPMSYVRGAWITQVGWCILLVLAPVVFRKRKLKNEKS